MRAEKAKRKQPNREADAAMKQGAADPQEWFSMDQLPSMSDLMQEMEFPDIDIADFDIDP